MPRRFLARPPQPAAGRPGAGGVLGIVGARQGRHVGEVGHVAVGVGQLAGIERDAAGHGDRSATGTTPTPVGAGDLGEDRARIVVVDADHGAVALLLAVEDIILGRDIARHVAMAVDMVGRDVEPHRDMGMEGLRAARADRTTAPARRCRPAPSGSRSSAPRPILPPTSHDAPAVFRIWPISAVVVDLPLVPVTPMKRLWAGPGPAARRRRSAARRRRAPPRPTGCGLGRRLGMPGLITRAVTLLQSMVEGSANLVPIFAASRAPRRCRPRRRSRRPPPSGRAPSSGRSAPAPARRRTNP